MADVDIGKGNPAGPGRYYDEKRHRLIYIGEKATPQFWDERWRNTVTERLDSAALKGSFVSRITRRFLRPEDGVILEGGCGNGQHVAALDRDGYRCIGIDYAKETIEAVADAGGDLDVRLGDVRQLEFPDAFFAGYWSLGVIEHFWDGYRAIAAEMARVVRPEGCLFVSFPHMSPLRRIKALLGMYPRWKTGDAVPERFYQFALRDEDVVEHLQGLGFCLLKRLPWDGIKGTKDELPWLRPFLQPLYDYRGASALIRGARLMLTTILAPLTGHVMILVMRRTSLVGAGSSVPPEA